MNNSVKFDAFDALLHASAIYAGQKELDEYESATGDEFDTKTQERIYRRLDKEYRYYSKDRKYSPVRETLKRIAIIILAFMSISFTCVLSIDAAREAIWNAIVEWSENFFCFKYEEPEEPNEPDEINLLEPPTEILEYKEPTVDEKFVKVEGKKTSQSYLVQYKYLNKLISYSQRPINPYDTFISNLEADLTCFRRSRSFILNISHLNLDALFNTLDSISQFILFQSNSSAFLFCCLKIFIFNLSSIAFLDRNFYNLFNTLSGFKLFYC